MIFKKYSIIIKTALIVFIRNIKKLKNINKKRLYLSFGENCLTDDILARYGIKSFSTPYSSGRSNIEYILQIEKDNFKDFLNPEFMKYYYLGKKRVVRLTKYDKIENQYDLLHVNGFEFTHRDVLNNLRDRKIFDKRVKRMLDFKNKEVNIFYHSRCNANTNEDLLLEHLAELKKIYEKRCASVNIYMFTQIIVSDGIERKLVREYKNGINIYKFHVLNAWQGDDEDIFYARCDDDLIKLMINDAKRRK